VAKNIEHAVANVEMDDKRFFLENMINNDRDKKILVFVRTKVRAERVKKALARVKLDSDTIHSDKLQAEREQTMRRFRSGELKVLIATDISARGIDVPNVDFVINYDLPESSDNYVHRVGRTGRGREKGQAISFCSTEEKEQLAEIEEALGKSIQRVAITKGEYQLILDTTEDTSDNWKQLMREAESSIDNRRKKKKKK